MVQTNKFKELTINFVLKGYILLQINFLFYSFRKTKFINTLIRDIAGRTASIVASHPFHVITIRAMAQFVGDEEKYW
jgi:hypothetical protein